MAYFQQLSCNLLIPKAREHAKPQMTPIPQPLCNQPAPGVMTPCSNTHYTPHTHITHEVYTIYELLMVTVRYRGYYPLPCNTHVLGQVS